MFQRLLGRERRANQAIVDALYSTIVASARQPKFYSDWGVPDTPLGRFEMLSLHVFLFLRRARGETGAIASIAQEITDVFFLEVDHSLRELGIGDVGVQKRVKKLARMFYGRAEAYGEALDGADATALAEALRRNVRPESAEWPQAKELATYVQAAAAALASQSAGDVSAGRLSYPAP
jgi:cytochrome b pre-mRNA-processing protein 3